MYTNYDGFFHTVYTELAIPLKLLKAWFRYCLSGGHSLTTKNIL